MCVSALPFTRRSKRRAQYVIQTPLLSTRTHTYTNIHTLQGAVRSYIGMGRIKEALTTAKDSLQRMPRNPKALTLVGIALSQLPEGLEKGKVAFEKARQLGSI